MAEVTDETDDLLESVQIAFDIEDERISEGAMGLPEDRNDGVA